MGLPDISVVETQQNLWIVCILIGFGMILLFICLRKWLSQKLCPSNDDSRYIMIGTEHKGDQLSKHDRERKFRNRNNSVSADDGKRISFLSESGRPLLFSFDESAYDDAAYLVDRTFEKPYQFTGGMKQR